MDGHTGTKDTESQATVIRSCEADEQLKITSKITGNIVIVQEVRGDKTRGGLTTSKRIYSKAEVICDRQQNVSKTISSGRSLSMQPNCRRPTGQRSRRCA